jgi:hypothetical protein
VTLPANLLLAPSIGAVRVRRDAADRRTSRDERRRLARQDVLSARLAELSRIGELLVRAEAIVGEGWVQHAWFRYRDEAGRARLATAHDLHRMADRPVIGACLVGAVVQAGGGPEAAGSQLVARTLDLAWHALREAPGRPVEWCPSPPVRQARVRDLTRWNDARGRRVGQVAGLLEATSGAALVESGRARQERARL